MYKFAPFVLLFVATFFLYSCSTNNVTTDDSLKKIFDDNQVTGSFGMFDNGQGQFTIYDLPRFRDSAYLPAATFEIVTALAGLETGKIVNEQMVINWDGVKRLLPNGDTATGWNKDLTMAAAFKSSAVPYFQEIAKRLGRDTLQHWLDTLGYASKYGKAVIRPNNTDTFWLDNSIKITADEQLGLVKKLYFDQLPFRKETTQNIVARLMMQEDNANYKLSYKTGWGFASNGDAMGWVIGWIEENKHAYFFAMNVQGPHSTNISAVSMKILKDILAKYGFMQGKK